MSYYLAFDIGASSGRAILGNLENGTLQLEEIHRFENGMVYHNNHYYWNVYQLFEELKIGLKKCIQERKIQPQSVGIDTWGVDFGLLNSEGDLIGLPFAYRDSITDNAPEELFKLIPRDLLYASTGLQDMQFNTLFQLFALEKMNYSSLKQAKDLLFIPDLLSYFFTGIKINEYTIASTSQMLNANSRSWESSVLKSANIDTSLLQDIVQPGTVIGEFMPHICLETGSSPIPVVAVASHDTASAVISAPAHGDDWAYLSSGTWSLMGVEISNPLTEGKAMAMNFTNEGGAENTIRLLKNIIGMWLIQECRRCWASEYNYSWPEMVKLAESAEPFKYLINPDETRFLNPPHMPNAIISYCEESGQGTPSSHAEIIRAVYDSLALKYKMVLDQLELITEKKITCLHIVGGGSNNLFLNQLTADVTGIKVVSGPTEATAIGNILMQAKSDGEVENVAQIRAVVRNSFDVREFIASAEIKNLESIKTYFKELI